MMKKLILFSLVAMTFFVSCNNSGKASEVEVISPQEVREAVYNNGARQLIDVRTPEEFSDRHLVNAQNICVTDADFKENVAKLDKDQPVYLYCRSGKRSARAAQILKDMGFKEIYDMDGGILKWEEEQLETEQ